jgi:hypothetical protein
MNETSYDLCYFKIHRTVNLPVFISGSAVYFFICAAVRTNFAFKFYECIQHAFPFFSGSYTKRAAVLAEVGLLFKFLIDNHFYGSLLFIQGTGQNRNQLSFPASCHGEGPFLLPDFSHVRIWIYIYTAESDFIVAVVSGRVASLADIPDNLSLPHFFSESDSDF